MSRMRVHLHNRRLVRLSSSVSSSSPLFMLLLCEQTAGLFCFLLFFFWRAIIKAAYRHESCTPNCWWKTCSPSQSRAWYCIVIVCRGRIKLLDDKNTRNHTSVHTYTQKSTWRKVMRAPVFYLHLGCRPRLHVIKPISAHIHTSTTTFCSGLKATHTHKGD